MFPLLNTELAPQTDEGVVQVSAELAAGTRIERTDAIMSRLEQMTQQLVPEAQTLIASAGAGGGGGGWSAAAARAAAAFQLFLVPKDQRERSSDQIAFELRRQLSGIPGVIVRANASGGNNQLNRLMSGGQGNDCAHGRRNPRRRSRGRAPTRSGSAGPAPDDARHRRPAARARRSASRARRADRSSQSRAVRPEHDAGRQHDSHERRGHDRGAVPPGRVRISDHRPPEAGRSRAGVGRQRRDGQHRSGVSLPVQERHGHSVAARTEPDRSQEPGAHGDGQRRA